MNIIISSLAAISIGFAAVSVEAGQDKGDSGKSREGWDGCFKHITICHIPPGNPENARAITISTRALDTHVEHHDDIAMGCDLTVGARAVAQSSCEELAAADNGDDPVDDGGSGGGGDDSGFVGETEDSGEEGTGGGPGTIGTGTPGIRDNMLIVLCDSRTGEIGRGIDASPVGRIMSAKLQCD